MMVPNGKEGGAQILDDYHDIIIHTDKEHEKRAKDNGQAVETNGLEGAISQNFDSSRSPARHTISNGNGHAANGKYQDPFSHPLETTTNGQGSSTRLEPYPQDATTFDMLPANWNETDLGLDISDLSPYCDTDDQFDEFGLEAQRTPKRTRKRTMSFKSRTSNLQFGTSSNQGLLSQARSILRSSFPGSVPDDEGHIPLSPSVGNPFKDVEDDPSAYPPPNDTSRVESTLRRWEREEMERRAAARKAKASPRRRPEPTLTAVEPGASSHEIWTARAHWTRDLLCCCCDLGEDDPHLDPERQYGERPLDEAEDPVLQAPPRNGKMRVEPDEGFISVVGHPTKPLAQEASPTLDESRLAPRSTEDVNGISPISGTPYMQGRSRWTWRKSRTGQTAKTNPFE